MQQNAAEYRYIILIMWYHAGAVSAGGSRNLPKDRKKCSKTRPRDFLLSLDRLCCAFFGGKYVFWNFFAAKQLIFEFTCAKITMRMSLLLTT